MNKKLFKMCVSIFITVSILIVSIISALALSWDGSSSGGGGNTTAATVNGYAIRYSDDNCLGYRFSVVDSGGNNKGTKVIDVFRNTTYGNYEYTNAYKFNIKYNKKQIISNQNNSFSTSKNNVNCYKEADMGFYSSLPTESGMSSWQNSSSNLNPILYKMSISGIAALKNGDKILVEPLYDVKLEGVYHSLTTSEIALYGKHILGANSNGGSSKNSGSWGFIAGFTNKVYPNKLYTPNGLGLWTGVSALSSQASFYTIINGGYGVGIAYTETKQDFSPSLSVNVCEAWPGSVSNRISKYYGFSNGSTFENWSYLQGYPILGDTLWYAVNFPAESENCYVRQSVWVVGGGSISRNVWSNSNTWYDVALSPTTVSANDESYTVKARVDWIDGNGNVRKWGTEKTFYIPIRPKVNRKSVTLYSVTGDKYAVGGDNSYGAVYYGQRVSAEYNFTSDNTFTSFNYFRGRMYSWTNNDWNPVKEWDKYTEQTDMLIDNADISSSYSRNFDSSIGRFTVPDNSANTNGENRIPFYLWTHWSTDVSRTTETRWINIPIVKADVEITNIRLVNERGYYVDSQKLEVGDKLTVQYTYKNNTGVKIYVNGYNDDLSKIDGIFPIEANSSINVLGYSFTVPNKRTLSIGGSVYLENAGRGNTSYETNKDNNEMKITLLINHPLHIYPIDQNASYTKGTEVITSFWIKNYSADDYIPTDEISIYFNVKEADGKLITTKVKSNFVVPGNDKNLVYFKWTVPSYLSQYIVKISASIIDKGNVYNVYSNEYYTAPYIISDTPDTTFQKEKPSGFTIPDVPQEIVGSATWWEYKYEYKKFVKKNYGIAINNYYIKNISPVDNNDSSSDDEIMKSGYPITIKIYKSFTNVVLYTTPEADAYTDIQYASALFPEFNFSTERGKYKTLDVNGMYWNFKPNLSYGNVHFTPIWYPDGKYTVRVIKKDCWTPSGMIKASVNTNALTIKDSVYDSWYVGQN